MELILGDCIEQMRQLPDASIDAVVTDPPYGINFMGKAWDGAAIELAASRPVNLDGIERLTGSPESPHRKMTTRTGSAFANRAGEAGAYDFSLKGNAAFQSWCTQWGAECLRVLKPGGHALVFGGTRTYHRLASGLEDAGFEIRDCLAWMFGQGFPKSLNLGDGRGTALKPAFEPIVMARKPLSGTVASTVLEHGTGALNIDACRLATVEDLNGGAYSPGGRAAVLPGDEREGSSLGMFEPGRSAGDYEPPSGRWPANVLLDEEAAAVLDAQTGDVKAGGNVTGREPSRPFDLVYGEMEGRREFAGYGDRGGPSRFFYCAKVSRSERNAGLDHLPLAETRLTLTPTSTLQRGRSGSQRIGDADFTPAPLANVHPTVKPIAVMRWLVRLVAPPGGVVLDPFLGSGTTGCAAALEGLEFIGIERETDYMRIAEARIRHWAATPRSAHAPARKEAPSAPKPRPGQLELELSDPTLNGGTHG